MVIRIPNWLGDAIMATPVYENVVQKLAGKEEVVLFGLKGLVELFQGFDGVKVVGFTKGNRKNAVDLLKPYKEHIGLLLPNSFSSAWIFWKAGLKERWGYARDLRGCLLTKKVKPPLKKLHQRDYYLYLVKKLNLFAGKTELSLPLEPEAIHQASLLLKENGVSPGEFVVFCPGAAYGPAKMWPQEYYEKLATLLLNQGLKVVVLGNKNEYLNGEKVKSGKKGVINLCGKTTLLEAAGIIYLSKAVVSNDSGLMHVAAALKKSQVAIFGSTDPELTAPLNPNAKVLKLNLSCSPCFKRKCKIGTYECLKGITPEQVFTQLSYLL